MKLTKENLITTLKSLTHLTVSCAKYSAKVGGGRTNEFFNGKVEAFTDIIAILEDEKEFEKVSDALMKVMASGKKGDNGYDA